jgi:hypothetical protein
MPWRPFTTACILAIAAGAVFLALLYGPWRRTYVSPPRAVAIDAAADAYGLWEANGMRGRIALVFGRHLIPAEREEKTAGVEAIERAMHHGMVREVHHVVPDGSWPEVAHGLAQVSIYWPTPAGAVAAFEDGRVNVVPLSRLWIVPERSLVLVDAGVWSPEEKERIAQRIRSGAIESDLIGVVAGTSSDLELLASAQASAGDREVAPAARRSW